jgi:uncharacterized protein
MMKTHSYLSKKCEVRVSPLAGKGVFAKKIISKGELISVWGGIIYSADEVEKLAKKFPIFNQSPVSVFEGFYIGPINPKDLDDAERFNHSCNPNAGIRGQIILVARRIIKRDEEICFDYDTTEVSAVPFRCKCGQKSCRRVIDGSGWKSSVFVEKNRDYLSWYILEKLNNRADQLM